MNSLSEIARQVFKFLLHFEETGNHGYCLMGVIYAERQYEVPAGRPMCRQGLGPRPRSWLIRDPLFFFFLHVLSLKFLYTCLFFF